MIHAFRTVKTCAGYVGFVATDRGLRRLFLPEKNRAALEAAMRQAFPDVKEDRVLLPPLASALEQYFAGDEVEFDVRFDWSGWSTFEIDVWRACQRIRYGQTRSYKDLAEGLRRPGAARAVGMAMSHNPFPIVVPCHRVVKSDGSLGGYSGPEGVAFKRRLLDMESAAVATAS
jgi:O-6-methylguanine DNA methyltransferase